MNRRDASSNRTRTCPRQDVARAPNLRRGRLVLRRLRKLVPDGPGVGRAVIWALNGRVLPRHPASTAVSLSLVPSRSDSSLSLSFSKVLLLESLKLVCALLHLQLLRGPLKLPTSCSKALPCSLPVYITYRHPRESPLPFSRLKSMSGLVVMHLESVWSTGWTRLARL